MKCTIILGYFAFILSVAFASNNLYKAYSEVMSYAQENIKDIRNMTGSAAAQCYEKLIVNIDRLVEVFHEDANICISNATAKRNSNFTETEFLKEREQEEFFMASITKYFNDCSQCSGIDFYNCLSGNADYSIRNMDKIKEISLRIISLDHDQSAKIDDEEENCIFDAVSNYKDGSTDAMKEFNSCF